MERPYKKNHEKYFINLPYLLYLLLLLSLSSTST